MSFWEIGTWLAAIVLGPGALLVFVLFLSEVRKTVRKLEKENSE